VHSVGRRKSPHKTPAMNFAMMKTSLNTVAAHRGLAALSADCATYIAEDFSSTDYMPEGGLACRAMMPDSVQDVEFCGDEAAADSTTDCDDVKEGLIAMSCYLDAMGADLANNGGCTDADLELLEGGGMPVSADYLTLDTLPFLVCMDEEGNLHPNATTITHPCLVNADGTAGVVDLDDVVEEGAAAASGEDDEEDSAAGLVAIAGVSVAAAAMLL